MKRKIISGALLAVMLSTMFTGCGASGGSSNGASATTAAAESASPAATTAETKETTATVVDPVTLKLFTIAFGDTTEAPDVAEEINKISVPKINAKIELNFINIGAWGDQMNLMLSSGEQIDLMNTARFPLANLVANGQIQPVDELVAQYGKGIVDAIGEDYVYAGKIGGKLYGITVNRDLAASLGFVARADILDKYGLSLDGVKALTDLDPILKKVKENETSLYPLGPQVAPQMTAFAFTVDNCGDTNNLGVLLNQGQELTFKNYFESEPFVTWCTTMYDWNKKGYLVPDILSMTETGDQLMKAGKVFGYLTNLKPGFDTQTKVQTGMDVKTVDIYPAQSSTSNPTGLCYVVPTSSISPQKAIEFMNLWNTDADVSNLIIYGIEGKHYQYVDKANNIIDYADGVDAKTIKYPVSMGWNIGNQFISHVWNGNPADYWKQMDQFNKSAIISKAMGFTFDATKVSTEYAACSSVVEQYKNALLCGSMDPTEGIPEFAKALKDAGLDAIIAEKQAQLDAWQKTK